MRSRTACAFIALGLLASCSKGDPAAPSSTTSGLTASIAAPAPVSPANTAVVRYADQPVTLMTQNAVSTTPDPVTYDFEVATDVNFASKVQTKDQIAQGSGGQTSVKLDPLAAAKDYYWHVRASGGGTTGVFGPALKFTVGPAFSLSTPVPVSPTNGLVTTTRPALTTQNAARQGQTGPVTVTYTFEIANNAAFSPDLVLATISEGASQTTFVPSSDLPIGVPLFWRVTATDTTNNVASNVSAVATFSTANTQQAVLAAQLGIVLWLGVQPPGTNGHATLGDNWQVQILHYVPQDVDFQSPTAEMLRFFDLFDRNMDPQSAINWMNANGYPTAAQWYPPPEKAVLGLQYIYLAARFLNPVNGTWDVVLKTE